MKLSSESIEDQSVEPQQDTTEEQLQPADVNMDLVLKVCDLVPRHTWPAVLEAAVANIVDELPLETMLRMCEMYLIDYYLQNPMEIIPDMFRIKGEEETLYILDSLQLDKIPVPKEKREAEEQQQQSFTDNAPSSLDPQ